MNLISGTHHSCERREHAFMILREYTIISCHITHIPLAPSIFSAKKRLFVCLIYSKYVCFVSLKKKKKIMIASKTIFVST